MDSGGIAVLGAVRAVGSAKVGGKSTTSWWIFRHFDATLCIVYRRHATSRILEALGDTPVVFLSGARQVGKSTLARHIAQTDHPARYLTLDDASVLSAARSDPQGFIDGLDGNVVLDEVQRAPGVTVAIKRSVDLDRRPGRFLLTGSADVFQLPRVAEYLVGRMEAIRLWPLSRGELIGVREVFVDAAFGEAPPPASLPSTSRPDLLEMLCRGGYPEAQARTAARRSQFFESYLQAMLLREIRELSAIEGFSQLPQLLGLVAARTGSHVNVADISRVSGMPQATVRRYLALLRTLLLVETVPAWSGNQGQRLVKSPKLYMTDTGMMAHVLGQDETRLAQEPTAVGPILETFVVTEIAKQLGWSRTRVRMHHARTHGGQEVDIVLEDERGRCVAIEVKATTSLSDRHLRGMRAFAELAGERLHRGIVLYTGHEVVPFGRKLYAMPVAAMWVWGASTVVRVDGEETLR